MKKTICIFMVMMILVAMAVPASAESEFVPSISYKDHPELVEPPVVIVPGVEVQEQMEEHCIEIIPVAEAIEKPEQERSQKEKVLVDVYEKLNDNTMEIPAFGERAEHMVIRDLFLVILDCENLHPHQDHAEYLRNPNAYVELVFDIGISPSEEVEVMIYTASQWVITEMKTKSSPEGQWDRPVKVENNGDGTITCAVKQSGIVAFCMEGEAAPTPPQSEDVREFNWLWLIVLLVCLICLILLLIPNRKRKETEKKQDDKKEAEQKEPEQKEAHEQKTH